MNTDTEHEFIPPLPGGGSWRWEGGQWVSNDPVVEAPASPETDTPAVVAPADQE